MKHIRIAIGLLLIMALTALLISTRTRNKPTDPIHSDTIPSYTGVEQSPLPPLKSSQNAVQIDMQIDNWSNTAQHSSSAEDSSMMLIKHRYRSMPLIDLMDAYDDARDIDKLELLTLLWRKSADLDVPNAIFPFLESITREENESLANKAREVINDLIHLSRITIAPQYDSPMNQASEVETHIEYLTALAYDADDNNRLQAVQGFQNLRNHEAMTRLLTLSTDMSSQVRQAAIQGIWAMAADGLDKDGLIKAQLTLLSEDPALSVATLATKALSDLSQLDNTVMY